MRCGFNTDICCFRYLLSKTINKKKECNIKWRKLNSKMLREVLKKHLRKNWKLIFKVKAKSLIY